MANTNSRCKAAIIAVGDALEAISIRTILESALIQVDLHLVGNPTDFLEILKNPDIPSLVIISGHGTENGLYFGEYGPEVDTSLLENGCLHPAKMSGEIHLKNQIVINTACLGGDIKYAEAFIKGGASSYLGSKEYIDFRSAVFFIHFYILLKSTKNMSISEAVERFNGLELIEEKIEFYDELRLNSGLPTAYRV